MWRNTETPDSWQDEYRLGVTLSWDTHRKSLWFRQNVTLAVPATAFFQRTYNEPGLSNPNYLTSLRLPSPMSLIPISATSEDHPEFVQIVGTFVEHYAQLYHPPGILIHHVDNWFGERWLGFAGKLKGAVGIRNRSVNNTTLPLPPFRPSRILSCHDFASTPNAGYQLFSTTSHGLHRERNGGEYNHLHRLNLYVWYSGNTQSNTNGSLMIYDVTEDGSTGWYIGLSRKRDWSITQTVNVTKDECRRILSCRV